MDSALIELLKVFTNINGYISRIPSNVISLSIDQFENMPTDSDLEGTLTSVFSWVSGPLTNAMHTDTNTCIQPHTDTHFIYTMIE